MKTNEKYAAVEVRPSTASTYAAMLQRTAERMLRLAEQLGKGDRELNAEERELLRFSALPAISDMFREMKLQFLVGENASRVMDELMNMFSDLCDRK